MRDYTHALELEPDLTSASINRAMLAYQSGRNEDAIADLNRACTRADSSTIGQIHYNLALVHRARGDRKSARASVQAAMAHGHRQARALQSQLGCQP